MPGQVQSTYTQYPRIGFPGQIAEAYGPWKKRLFPLNIPSGGRKARPGDAVFWNRSNNAMEIPTTGADRLRAEGVICYLADDVGNEDSIVEYNDGDMIEVLVEGVVYVRRGGGDTLEYGDLVHFNYTANPYNWSENTPTAFANIGTLASNAVANINNAFSDVNTQFDILQSSTSIPAQFVCVYPGPFSGTIVPIEVIRFGYRNA